MLTLKIGNNKTRLKVEWHEITARDAINLMGVAMPESFHRYVMGEIDEYTPDDRYMRQCFDVLCTERIPGGINPADVVFYFAEFIYPIICDLANLRPSTYRPSGERTFKFMGDEYHLPAPLVVDNGFIPAHEESAEAYTEGADLLRNALKMGEQGVNYFPALAATYLRKKGEQYSEALQLERAELFMALPMDVCWEVFFYVYRSANTLMQDFVFRKTGEMQRLRRQLRRQAWIRSATGAGFTGWLKRAWQGIWTK